MTMIELLLWWTVKGTLILALAWAIALLLRRQPAALRHAVWASAIAAQLLVPFAGRLVPEQATIRVTPPRFAMPGVEVAAPAAATPVSLIETAPAPAPAAAPQEPVDRDNVLRWIWIAGAIAIALRLLAGTARIAGIARRSMRVVDGEWLARTQSHTIALGIVRPVTLVWSAHVPLPITWGFVYPTILLPETARTWPESFRRHVLLHELAHVRRFDALTQLLTQVALAAFWFNPLLWFAAHRLRAEAENACDDYVLRDGERPSTYATTLVELVRSHAGPTAPAFASLSVGRKSDLESRVGAIVQPARNCAAPGRPRLALIAVTMVLIVVPLAGIEKEELEAAAKERKVSLLPKASINCRPVYFDNGNDDIGGMSGTFRRKSGEPAVNYFFHKLDGRCIEGMFSLATTFTPDDRDVAAVPGLDALVREKTRGTDRVVYLRSDGTSVERRFVVNGRERAWDSDAQRWYASLMPEFIRRTYAGIPDRAHRIVARGGVEGLLSEIGELEDADVRKLYLLTLFDRPAVDAIPRPRIVRLGTELLASSEAVVGSFLAEVAEREGSRPEVLDAVLENVERLPSDVERRIVLEKLAASRRKESRMAALARIDVLRSDVERRDLLQGAAAYFLGNDERLNTAFFDAVDTLRDDVEMKEMLVSLAHRPSLPASVIARIMRAAESIRDEHERSEVLRAFDVR
jgi:beta-lactamase regulating signal transducer with metallopeptidase domain